MHQVLFHDYATGNLPVHKHPESFRTRFPADDDKLPLFLRSAIPRPDPAAQVIAPQLVDTDAIPSLRRPTSSGPRRIRELTLTYVYRSFGIDLELQV